MEDENVASFLGKEISGPDHAIDFHVPTVRIFLSVFLTTPSFVAFVRTAGNLDISCIDHGDVSILEYRKF